MNRSPGPSLLNPIAGTLDVVGTIDMEHPLLDLWHLVLGTAPGLLWLWFFVRRSRCPERGAHAVWIFALGGVAAVGVIGLRPLADAMAPATRSAWAHQVVDAFLVTAPLEEALKAAALFGGLAVLGSRLAGGAGRPEWGARDGVLLGVAAGLGFASTENVHYLMEARDPWLAVGRAFTAMLLHAATTGTVGFFAGSARGRPAAAAAACWLGGGLVAIASHGAYTLGTLSGPWGRWAALLGVLPGMLVLLSLELRAGERATAEVGPHRP